MALTLRRTVPCGHCLGQPTCATVWHELQNTVERLNWFAEAHGMRFSDIDLILDCHSYSAPSRNRGESGPHKASTHSEPQTAPQRGKRPRESK